MGVRVGMGRAPSPPSSFNFREENWMYKKLVTACVALFLGAGLALTAFAQAKPDALVKQRTAAMTLLGKYFYGELRLMARGKIPYDADRANRAAGFVDALSRMPWDGFHPSTAKVTSGALPAVFDNPAKFRESADLLQSETSKLVAAVKTGDEAAVKAQIAAVDKACSSCHKVFRE
jgi:cytochrome c556